MQSDQTYRYHNRSESLVYFKEEILSQIRNTLPYPPKKILFVGNTHGTLPTLITKASAPGTCSYSIHTHQNEVLLTRTLASNMGLSGPIPPPTDTSVRCISVRKAYLGQCDKQGEYDVIIFHPTLRPKKGVPFSYANMRSALVRACTRMYELLNDKGMVIVLALNPKWKKGKYLSKEYRTHIKDDLTSGFEVVHMKIIATEEHVLRGPKRVYTKKRNFSEEENYILNSLLYMVAKK